MQLQHKTCNSSLNSPNPSLSCTVLFGQMVKIRGRRDGKWDGTKPNSYLAGGLY